LVTLYVAGAVQQPESNDTPLTPLLSPSLPDVTYHVYVEQFNRFRQGTWFYFHVKNEDKTATLYTLAALKGRRLQIPVVSMSRASEYHTNCASIVVEPLKKSYPSAASARIVGRTFRIQTATTTVVADTPDRLEKEWTPRRFTYGGRKFVWKESGSRVNFIENLHEVKREWPDPNSKTGKILDEVHSRRLVWGESKFAMSKVCTIHMVGGLDQMFREFLLASQVTKMLILLYGHHS
jgi:hypothetical protein